MAPNNPEAGYDQAEGEAFERYVVDLIKGLAAEQLRAGFVGFHVLKDVRLAGDSYPHSEVEVDSVSKNNPERKFTGRYSIDQAKDRETAKQIAFDILFQLFD
jgi:hypothetical protein